MQKGFGKRHLVFLAVILTNFIVWLDDAIFGTLTPLWGKALALSPTEIATVSAAYLLGYFPLLFIAGVLSDRIGAKRLLILCLAGCTVLSAMMLLIHTYNGLWWRNFVFGIFFGLLWAPCNRLIAIWFPAHERVRYTSLWFSSTMAAFGLSGPIGLSIAGIFSWQASFIIVSVLAIPIMIMFLIVVKDRPEHHPKISRQEIDYIYSDRMSSESQGSEEFQWRHLRDAFKKPSVYLMAIAAGLATTPNWLVTVWGSYGLINGYKVSPEHAGIIISLMYAIPLVLGFSNSWVVNKLFKGRTRAALALGPALGGISFLLATVFSPNYIIYSLLVYGIAASSNIYFWGTLNAYWAGLTRPEVTGTLNGISAAMQVAFGYILISNSGGWINQSIQGPEALNQVWLYGGIMFLVTIIFVVISKEVKLNTDQFQSKQFKNTSNSEIAGKS